MHFARVCKRLTRLQIQFRISRSFRPQNQANLRSNIRFWIRRKKHNLTFRECIDIFLSSNWSTLIVVAL